MYYHHFLKLLSTTYTIFDGVIGNNGGQGIDVTIGNLLKVAWWLGAMLAVAFIAYGGFKYTTSGGDSNKTSEAKSTILNGVIGLVVVLSIAVIFSFVLRLV